MADYEITTVAPGVTHMFVSWGYVLRGPMDKLISSGLCKACWFPTWRDRDSAGRIKRQKKVKIDGRYVKVMRPAIGQCSVWIFFTQTERAEYGKPPADFKTSNVGDIANRLDQYVAKAIRDYNDGKEQRKRTMGVSHGVTRHAHAWCVDFFGSRDELVQSGLALEEWLDDDRSCKKIKVGSRCVEIYKNGYSSFGPIEISAQYTQDEIDRIG